MSFIFISYLCPNNDYITGPALIIQDLEVVSLKLDSSNIFTPPILKVNQKILTALFLYLAEYSQDGRCMLLSLIKIVSPVN